MKKKKILAVIPARMASSRFPGKPMANLNGVPMIGHVYNNIKHCSDLDDTIIATCDTEIKDYILSIGGDVVMTRSDHERASDRTAEAVQKYEKKLKTKFDIVIMVQGDEPMVNPEMLSQAVSPFFKFEDTKVSNLMSEIKTSKEFKDRNCIKVVCDQKFNAIYFSREPIPSTYIQDRVKMHKQVCIIPFERKFLDSYNNMKPTPLEISESIDMLRIIENGYKVKMVMTDYNSKAVDTPEDLIEVEKLIQQ